MGWTEITVPTYGIESTCTLVPYRVYRTMRRVVCILQYVHTKVCRMQDSVLSTGDALLTEKSFCFCVRSISPPLAPPATGCKKTSVTGCKLLQEQRMMASLVMTSLAAAVAAEAAGAATADACCTRTPPRAVKARIYNQSFSRAFRRNTAGQAAALVASAFLVGNSSGVLDAPPSGSNSTRLAYCVTGQARGLNPVRELGRALAGGQEVDVFAVIEADCMPHFCSGDVLGRIKRWLAAERVERAIITVNGTYNGTYEAGASTEARSSNVGAFAKAPSVHGCMLRQRMKRAHPNWPSTFWHQQMRAQQCFSMVKAAEARRGVRYDWVVRARPEFASGCVCPPSRPLSPSRIYSIDSSAVRCEP